MRHKSRVMVLSLALLFMLPSFIAYVAFTHPHWFALGTINRGQLLQPVVHHPAVKQNKKWQVLMVTSIKDAKHLNQVLDKVYRVRLSLGKGMKRTSQTLIIDGKVDKPLELKRFETVELLLPTASFKQFGHGLNTIFIADPHANIILAYPLEVKPDDVYSDLKRLLKVSKIG